MIEDIKHWVNDFVSIHNERLGQIPCPFAKQAVISNTVRYIHTERIGESLSLLIDNWCDDYEVVILYADIGSYTSSEVSEIVQRFNELAMPLDLVALEDHPDDPELLNGVAMNFGKAILVLVQRLSKLNRASEILEKRGYYKNWPRENYNDVVAWRKLHT